MVQTPGAAAVAAGAGGEQRGGSLSAISNRLGNSSGWDVEADAAVLELLLEDRKALSEVNGHVCVTHMYNMLLC